VPVTPTESVELEKGQHPFATVLGCSDSRVPVELLFDQGLGDLFIIRLAGHIVDPHVQGSMEYAFKHLDAKLIIVLGHEGCGAVTAAMAARESRDKEPFGILHVLERIEPIFQDIDESLPQAEKLRLAVEANVRLSMKRILSFPGHVAAQQRGEFEIVGAVYDMHTGKVRFLDREEQNVVVLEKELAADAEDVVFCSEVAVVVAGPTVDVIEHPAELRVPVPVQPDGHVVLHAALGVAGAAQIQIRPTRGQFHGTRADPTTCDQPSFDTSSQPLSRPSPTDASSVSTRSRRLS